MRAQLHDGRFELLSSLGEGGFGTVYEAYDRSSQARVALKVLTRLNPDALLRFKREFRAAQDLAHPNLVTLGELFEADGQWFFTMELVPGCDFLRFVRPSSDAFDEQRLRVALRQLAEALSALHSADTIHRDVKPANIRVTPQGRLVVLDFGLITCRHDARQTTAAGGLGTAAYMAPEQAMGERSEPAADWYSFGVVLYEALTGVLPFPGGAMEVLMRERAAPPPSPSARAPGIPADLDRLCAELLEARPRLRPSGTEVLACLHVEPSPSLAAPRLQVLGATSRLMSPFLGRNQELAALADAAAASRSPETTAIYVHGVSGIGKSALVRHFTDELEARDPRTLVLRGRCFERETVPYKAFDGVIDELSGFLRRLTPEQCAGVLPLHVGALTKIFPVLNRVEQVAQAGRMVRPSVDRRTQREQAFAALRELLTRLSERVGLGVVLVIDDLQWADADSLLLLEALLAPSEPRALLLIATGRDLSECPEPIQRAVTGLVRASHHSRCLEVRELSGTDARDLAAQQLAHYGGDVRDAELVVQQSAAQPLWIDELSRFVSLHATSGARPDLDQMLTARFLELSPEEAKVLSLVALASVAVPQDVVVAAASLVPNQQMQVLKSLRHARLIKSGQRSEHATLETFHDRVRVCVASALSPRERASCYRALARSMQASSEPDPAALAVFWMEAGETDRAAEYALQAGDLAGDALAFERAASLYRRVLAAGATREQRWQLFTKLGEALAHAGRCPDAADAFVNALEGAPDAHQFELLRRACQQLLQSGHLDRGLAVADDLLARVGVSLPKTPGRALRSLTWQRIRLSARGMKFKERASSEIAPHELSRIDALWSVATALSVVDHIRALELETRLLRHLLDAGEPRRLGRGLALESSLRHPRNARGRALARASIGLARDLATRHDDPHGLGLCFVAEGICAVAEGELRRCVECCDAAAAILGERCTDVTWERNNAASFGLLALHYLGDHAELARRVPRLLRDASERGDLYAGTSCVLIGGVSLALRDGQADRARAEVDEVMSRWSESGFYLQHFLHMVARVQIDLYQATPERESAAHRFVLACWPALVSSQLLRAELVQWPSLWARGRATLAASRHLPRERTKMLRAALADGKRLERCTSVIARGCGALLRAGALDGLGLPVEALRAQQQGCVLLEQAEANALHWCARLRLAERTHDAEGLASARAWLRARGVSDPERFARMNCPL